MFFTPLEAKRFMNRLTRLICVAASCASSSSYASPAEDAIAAARKNAKQALTEAISKLQETAGPDQRITARADILGANVAQPRLTGVWNSWEIKATTPPVADDYSSHTKGTKFLSWLVSNQDPTAPAQIDYINTSATSPVTLMGLGTLGSEAPSSSIVTASKVQITSPPGAYAWAVLDEGVKARINTPFSDTAASTADKTQQLGSGERPGTEFLPGLSGLSRASFESSSSDFANFTKGIGNTNFAATAEAIAPGTAAALKPLAHDVTLHSLGIFTDTARGGLKQDFSLLTNTSTLPTAYNKRGVYSSRLGLSVASDPRWESFQQFASLYRDNTKLFSSAGVPVLNAQVPTGWVAARGSSPNMEVSGVPYLTPAAGPILMPTVAKIQMVFSLAIRDLYNYPRMQDGARKISGSQSEEEEAALYNPWVDNFAGSSYDYNLHLIHTPVVTLHNPYNVALEFDALTVTFANVPFAMQVIRNGVAQTTGLVPLDQMYFNAESGNQSKRFVMNLFSNGGTSSAPNPGSRILRLLPGEVITFSPYLDPNRTWSAELRSLKKIFFDWASPEPSITNDIEAIPGWRGPSIGYDLDWFCPIGRRISSSEFENNRSMSRGGIIPARASDTFSVKFAPLSVPRLSANKFRVEIFAKPKGATSSISSGLIEMDYQTPVGLQDTLLGSSGTLTYPQTGSIPCMEMHSHSLTPLRDIIRTKPFAIVSMQAKTTFGGYDPNGIDGKFATKPWAFAHAPVGTYSWKNQTGHQANQSHEFSIQRLDEFSAYSFFAIGRRGNGRSITGNSPFNGVKYGALYDIPLAPIQSFASLNGANPGGSSGYLPRFAQPIGNSWAHPLMDTSKITEPGAEGYTYADHSFLLNLAFYDGFYFSGLADQTGSFGLGNTSQTLATRFANGTPLNDPRLILYRPDDQLAASFPAQASKASAYSSTATWQLMAGAFNVNSTSVPAWMAMLASVQDSQSLYSSIDKTSALGTSTLSPLPATPGKARISRFRLPSSASYTLNSPSNEDYWLGPREFSKAELQILAERIVEQVRLRGPFLSMAEFVNRRLGPATDPSTQRGALQQAIDNTDLNEPLASNASAGYDIPPSAVADYQYKNPSAGSGPSYQGAPGYLTQADLLTVLGNAATVRSDTFIVRSYGETKATSGETTATAYCEAVVQRLPDWIDPVDKADTPPSALTSTTNKTFGRGFRVIAFRWLTPEEI